MTIRTRVAVASDHHAIAVLFDAYRQFYEQPPNLQQAMNFIGERLRNGDSVLIVAEDERIAPIGFCQLYPSFCSIEAMPIYVLSDLYVQQNNRQHGAGKALLLAAERHAVANGRGKMELTTARTNKTAQAAYESLGWQRDEVFFGYGKRVEA
ncbi:MAG: GNAT family N-acetyltransferase [Burkholderiales bacterium]|nr:GNAT family N-acetyltransferase [Burkholderiales bacterium]